MKAAKALFFLSLLSFGSSLSAQDVAFSMPHGMYNESIEVAITTASQPDCVIRYTTDGRTPTPSDPEYTAPLTIGKTTVLRAAAIPKDATDGTYTTPLSSVTTCTYLFPGSILCQSDDHEGYPSTWGPFCEIEGTAPADYGMDQELIGNKTFSRKAAKGLEQLPWLSVVTDPDNLFSHETDEKTGGIYIYTGAPVGDGYGEGWERPVSFELFDSNGRYDIQANCGIRIHGGHSSIPEKNPKHSFRLAFRKEYGTGKLKVQLFGPGSPDRYNKLVIRTFGNNSWQHWRESNRQSAQYARDMWARETQRKMGHEYIRGTYVHLFLNGLYWGLYYLSEKPDDDYCSDNFGGKKEDYDIFKDGEPDSGNSTMWNMVSSKADSISALKDRQKESYKVLERLERILDIDNFIDYMILGYYAANTDWDMHNWVAFANRKEGTGFKFLCWDSELIFGNVNEDMTGTKDGAPTRLFLKLMDSNAFKHRFASRVARHCSADGVLTPDSVRATWDALYSQIDMALYDESARWGDYRRDVHPYEKTDNIYTPDNFFAKERSRLINDYFPKRTGVLMSQFKSRGWLNYIDAPRILVDGTDIFLHGDTVFAGSRLEIQTPLSLYSTYFTVNGDNPVSWETSAYGGIDNDAVMYSSASDITDLFKDSESEFINFTLKAVCRHSTTWGPIAEHDIVLQNPTATGVSTVTEGKRKGSPAISISGTPATAPAPGLYIVDGVKVMVK